MLSLNDTGASSTICTPSPAHLPLPRPTIMGLVVIPEHEEEAAEEQELLEQDNCVWYIDRYKKDTGFPE